MGIDIMIEEIGKELLLPIIRVAFANDEEIHKYHIEPGTFEEMCESNYRRIIGYEERPGELKFYKIVINDSVMGYQVVHKHEGITRLISFGINVLFRKSFLLEEWVKKIKEQFGNVIVPLYEKNYRAIRFFMRNGYKIGSKLENAVFLWQ